ncbi:hypothetical protein BH10PAT3_BH10PAT3_4600 [soil metagenome]
MKIQKKLFIFSTILVLAGLAGLLPYAYFWNQQRIALATSPSVLVAQQAPLPAPAPDLIIGKPVHISITNLSIDLTVADGTYDSHTRKWTLSNDKAHYALPSTQSNNKSGNTLIYGHATARVFGHINKITAGTKATIMTDNGYRFTYIYKETVAVDPTNVDILSYTGKPRLTLQTCSGGWWQNRQFYFFDLVSIDKV